MNSMASQTHAQLSYKVIMDINFSELLSILQAGLIDTYITCDALYFSNIQALTQMYIYIVIESTYQLRKDPF